MYGNLDSGQLPVNVSMKSPIFWDVALHIPVISTDVSGEHAASSPQSKSKPSKKQQADFCFLQRQCWFLAWLTQYIPQKYITLERSRKTRWD
jgi:hypothetical protein